MTLMTRQIVAAMALAGTLTGCASPGETKLAQAAAMEQALIAEGYTPVGAGELSTILVGHTHSGTNSRGTGWKVFFSADGTMTGTSNDGKETDSGTYSVSPDGTYCRRWSKWSDGKEGCLRFLRKGNSHRMVYASGKIDPGSNDLVIVAGNAL